MKRKGFYLMPLFALLLLCSCSDDAGDKETATNTAVEKPGSTPETSPSVAKEKRSDVAAQGLKGKVEVMSETILRGDSKKMASRNVFKYDEKGNMIELANYKADGKLNSTFKSIYDANGNLVSEQTLLGDGKVDLTSTIKTDAKGNKIEQEDKRGGNDLLNKQSFFVNGKLNLPITKKQKPKEIRTNKKIKEAGMICSITQVILGMMKRAARLNVKP